MSKSIEVRVRAGADRLSSRSYAVRPKHESCKRSKCEERPAVQGLCFDHWRKRK